MAKMSAGLVVYRFRETVLEIFLVHPGGPFWAKKDEGAWSIPKGEYVEGEEPLAVARREFEEETGHAAPDGECSRLATIKQPGGKLVSAWACRGNFDAAAIRSNTFTLEWPPRSGRKAEFPEIDRAGWFPIEEAKRKLLKGQIGILEELCRMLGC